MLNTGVQFTSLKVFQLWHPKGRPPCTTIARLIGCLWAAQGVTILRVRRYNQVQLTSSRGQAIKQPETIERN